MTQIICKDLSLGYDGYTVCEGLNFELNKGDYLCIVGDNGTGKSTLIKALLSLKSASSGSIELCGGITRSSIGYLPQHSEAQKDFPALVSEVVISGCTGSLGKRLFMGRAQKLEAMQNMKIMGIEKLAKQRYRTLSGGQQQRVLLARALCATSKILLLDEPISGLDPHAAADMYDLIHHLNDHLGITIIMVTHDIENALRDANKVLIMSKNPEFFDSVDAYRERIGGEVK